jgi:energy-coupling factor transport system ATP-binding protein
MTQATSDRPTASQAATAPISLREISFTYDGGARPALDGVTLTVAAGQIHAIVGLAGAGKSTLAALCAGFMPAFFRGELHGSASVAGQDVLSAAAGTLAGHVALVGPDAFSQISGARFSVFEEVAFGLENLGVPVEAMVERIEWALAALELGELRDRSPYALSGGQQQRLAIASALALRPAVLALDEPTAQLDPTAIARLGALLRSLAAQGVTILVAEHRLEWAAEFADRVSVLHQGQIVAEGGPEVLADQALPAIGLPWPRPTALAEQARAAGHFPAGLALPATVGGLVDGLRPRAPAAAQWLRRHSERAAAVGGAAVVAVEQVRYRYPSGVEALQGVSLRIGAGEQVALLGRNGAGKSTLVRHLNGLRRPSAGRVLVAGQDTRSLSVARASRQVGVVFQDVRNQLFARTVRGELRYGPHNQGLRGAALEARVEAALAALGLEPLADEHPYDLPLSTRRLVAVAAVLAMEPALLVLDEPTAGLDGAAVDRLAGLIRARAGAGGAVLVVSHDLDFCREALDRVVLMGAGRLLLDCPWASLDAGALDTLAAESGLPTDLSAARQLGLS